MPDNTTATAAAQEPMLAMIAPDGTSGSVPQSRVDEAVKAGGKLGVHMIAPDGSKGVVPFERQDAAQKAGGKWDVHPENDAVKVARGGGLGKEIERFTDSSSRDAGR